MALAVMPVIDLAKCNGCGLCLDVCSRNAIILLDKVITIVEIEDCGWCLECEIVCPTGAITCPFEIVVKGPKGTNA